MIARRDVLFLIAATFLSLTAATSLEARARDSGAFVKDLADRAIRLLTSKDTTQEEQERRFRELLREGFAVEKIGKFVLGKYRRQASKEELREYLALFEDYIVSLYASAFRNFSGATFSVKRVVRTRSPRDTMVVTQIAPSNNGAPTRIVFQVRAGRDGYKILDVKIEGVSMIITQRDEFTTFIANHGGRVSALIEALRKKTKDLKTRAASTR